MADTVRAAVQTGPRSIEIREFPRPRIGPDDGLLRVEANGICGSDVETFRGHMGYRERGPFIPGHEPLGVIEELGERAAERWGVRPGDRVALEVIVPCRSCQHCLTGRYQSCPNRKYGHGVTPIDVEPALWGGLAEYLYISPGSVLHRIDLAVPVEVAAMFNPLGAGVRWAAQLGGVRLGDTVLVLGSGQRGIASVIAARAAGAGTIIITGLESDRHKLDLAREFGADHTVFADSENTVERVQEITGGAMADVVLELTPMAAAPVTDALLSARHGGRVVLAGLKGGKEIPLRTDLIINRALQVFGAFGVDATANEQAIAIIESGRFPLEKLHTHTFGLDDTVKAIETLAGEIPGEQAVHVSVHPNF
ncbi:alcohol dehydrogenase catalytic domain-containing protein [Amycolatopsis acidiphila]|uniref:Zinc-binding dehydrogenase n=1 Tax=Amycolatopsis acidiphila TaxID=715473 RepID=A0A558A475_9PSEU|nr:alcohol dehydrogenase catalytic domain-containing protein [Amycolatopsis acidiphila]TVT19069.1 zinc-binding dehydrogenase [Amycolatopsis acidiphila]UIJ63688.1 alcohol dehydrogenase catalytic domain-containing protein [Amycolatopsis acidiphila]GHG67448.1 putative alcohol dehydrogenase adh [Amycolatopsis acidiphila]